MVGTMGGRDGGTRYAIRPGRRASHIGPGAIVEDAYTARSSGLNIPRSQNLQLCEHLGGVNTDKGFYPFGAAVRDNRGLVNVLEEQYGITRYPPGRLPAKGVPCLQDWRVAARIRHETRRRLLE